MKQGRRDLSAQITLETAGCKYDSQPITRQTTKAKSFNLYALDEMPSISVTGIARPLGFFIYFRASKLVMLLMPRCLSRLFYRYSRHSQTDRCASRTARFNPRCQGGCGRLQLVVIFLFSCSAVVTRCLV